MVDEIWHAVSVYNYDKNNSFQVDAIVKNGKPDNLFQLYLYLHSLRLWHKIFPEEIVYSRAHSIFWSAILMILFYFSVKSIFRDALLIFAALSLLVVDNIFFIATVSVRSDFAPPLFCFVLYLVCFSSERFEYKSLRLALSGLLFIIFFLFHPNVAILAAAFWFATIIVEKNAGSVKDFLIFLLPSALISGLAISYLFFFKHTNPLQIIEVYIKKTLLIEKVFQFDLLYIFEKEKIRYLDFIQFPYRFPIAVINALALVFYLFSKNFENKKLKIFSLTVLLTLIFFLLLFNKTSRYFIALSPILIILTIKFLENIFYGFLKGAYTKKLFFMVLSSAILYSFSGNVYLILKFADTGYKKFKESMFLEETKNKVVYGDLLLWDIFRNSKYISYNSDNLKLEEADYIIVKSLNVKKTENLSYNNSQLKKSYLNRRKTLYETGVNPLVREKGTLIKKINAKFYGEYLIYKINK